MSNTLIDGLKERVSQAITINNSVGVILPSSNYSDMMQALFEYMSSRNDHFWVYVAIAKPYENIVQQFDYASQMTNIRFIDCVSRAAGLTNKDPNCIYIESPSYLEKIIIEIMNIFNEVGDQLQKTLVIDSLTSLSIYNDNALIAEFFTHLINRTRLKDIHTFSLAIEEEMDDYINKILYLRSNKIIKLRESFI